MRQNIRNDKTHKAILMLIRSHVVQPLGKEALRIVVGTCRAGKYLRISHPAKTFIALRTVRRDIDKIALLAPDDVGEQLVQHRV